tara:strand:+ start:347 stop:730 length:384 start_codon:yes stop_codon:yes gene_type:complete
MATRSSSNRGVSGRNTNVPPAARNYQDTTQAVRRIPGVEYGKQKQLTEQQQAAPLPKDTMPQEQPKPMANIDVFGVTQKPTEPVTAGLPFGPGVGPVKPPQQSVNDLLYQMYAITGDTALLQLVDFD